MIKLKIDSENVKVGKSRGRGRGVFATTQIRARQLVERCPVLVVPKSALDEFDEFAFEWTKHKVAVALGCGSLYNHSYEPNARYKIHKGENTISFVATKNIEPGEEIFVNYNGDPADQSPVWFDAK